MSEIGYVVIPIPETPPRKPSNEEYGALLRMAREAAEKAGGTLTSKFPELSPLEYDGFVGLRFEMTR